MKQAIQDVRPIYLRGILDAAIKVAVMSGRSTINGRTMQIGLWISLYGFQSRHWTKLARSDSTTAHAQWDAVAPRINYTAAAAGRCGRRLLCVVERVAGRCLSPSICAIAPASPRVQRVFAYLRPRVT